MVSQPVAAKGLLLFVPNTLAALQHSSRWARKRWNKPIVAVTGSAGKTTTKDTIADLLSVRFRIGKTAGNLNNHLGLPLSLLRLPFSAEVGVMELGMNHAGEIRFLASIAQPQIGVITNVGYAHIENFESIDGIAAAKRELVEALPTDGVAILNADDERVAAFKSDHPNRVITYGVSSQADVRGEKLRLSPSGVEFYVEGTRFRSVLTGQHGASNILAGIAVARIFGIATTELTEAVRNLQPGRMRGERKHWRGATILDDCYNSNPYAARFMIDVLRAEPAQRRIAVLGEMLELGGWTEALHREIGQYAANEKIDVIIGVQGAARYLVEAAVEAGIPRHCALFFNEPEQAGEFLRDFVSSQDAILFKGSRGTHVERALAVMES